MTVVTAHQSNFAPGLSVFSKITAADVVLWLDEVRFTTGGWINRNRLPDGTWLTVPVDRKTHRDLIREVLIAEHGDWQRKIAATLRQHYGSEPFFDEGLVEIVEQTPSGAPLVELTRPLLTRMLSGLGVGAQEVWQSDTPVRSTSISQKLAASVKKLGGTTYLSGPSGRKYLDLDVFKREGVEVAFFDYAGPNPCALDALFREGKLPTGPRQKVIA